MDFATGKPLFEQIERDRDTKIIGSLTKKFQKTQPAASKPSRASADNEKDV